jgi:hypothetical protein
MLDLDALFDTVEQSAFRLEPIPRTGRPGQATDLALDLGWHLPWFDAIRRAVDAGRVVQRVRVMDQPPTRYQRFELSLGPFHEQAGEDLRILAASTAHRLDLPPVDFWLLDNRRVVTLDDAGAQVTTAAAVVRRMRGYRELAWQHAVPFARFLD